MRRKKSIFNWNHISDKLGVEEIEEIKSYYRTYHRKFWSYKQAMKRFKKLKLIGNSLSIVFASGGIASAAASGGIALIGIAGVSLLIKCWMEHQNLDLKVQNCQYAYQTYAHLLIDLKESLRIGQFDRDHLINKMSFIDGYVTDNSPPIDKHLKKYNKIFID